MRARLELAAILPVLNQFEVAGRCLELLAQHALGNLQILLVDNGSDLPVAQGLPLSDLGVPVSVVRRERNVGLVESLLAGLEATAADLIAYLHTDLLLHEPGWDAKVREAFARDARLGLAGVIAARGIGGDGGRIETHSHLLGRELGSCECHDQAWQHHGQLMPAEGIAAAVLDGCGLFLRREAVEAVGIDREYPLHHWYDREWSCAFLAAGWHLRGLDLRCDHGSGFTACREVSYHESAERYARKHYGIMEAPRGWDLVMYQLAERRWRRKWGSRVPVVVEPDHTVHWLHGRPWWEWRKRARE